MSNKQFHCTCITQAAVCDPGIALPDELLVHDVLAPATFVCGVNVLDPSVVQQVSVVGGVRLRGHIA